jgi:hypothetical protein
MAADRREGVRDRQVAVVVGDGPTLAAGRGPDALLEPDAIAEVYYQLHVQPRTGWTLELDVRPWVERF